MMRERFISAIAQAIAEFISRESNRRSLITVTKVELSENDRVARIFVSVMPQDQAHAAIDFLTRNKDEARFFLKKRIKSRMLPYIEFLLDPDMGN